MTASINRLNKSLLKFLTINTIDEAYKTIIDEASFLLGRGYGSIYLLQEGEFRRMYTTLPKFAQITPRKRGYMYAAFKKKMPLAVDIKNIKKVHPEFKEMPAKSTIFISLSYKNKTIGVLTYNSFVGFKMTAKEKNILKLYELWQVLLFKMYNRVKRCKKHWRSEISLFP